MRKNRNLLIVLILVISISTLVPVFARYVKEINSKVNIQSDKFYFTVDLLGDTNTDESLEKTYYFYGGDTKEVTFSIQNYFDDYRICDTDVKYEVTMNITSTNSKVVSIFLFCLYSTIFFAILFENLSSPYL